MPDPGVDIKAEVKGAKEVQKEMDRIVTELTGSKMARAMGQATLIVVRAARKNAPVDTGVLRASIVPEVRVLSRTVTGIVGSNVKYAPYIEFGTRPHTPPRGPIWRWALRKSRGNKKAASALFIRAIIGISRRGVKAKRYLQRALESSQDRVVRLINNAVGNIVRGR